MLIEALLILHIELKCFDHHLAQSSSNPLNFPCNASASLVFFLDRYQFVIPVPFCWIYEPMNVSQSRVRCNSAPSRLKIKENLGKLNKKTDGENSNWEAHNENIYSVYTKPHTNLWNSLPLFWKQKRFQSPFYDLTTKVRYGNLSRKLTEIDNFLLNTRDSFFLNEKSRYYNLSSKPSDDVVVKYEELCYINMG